MHKYICICVINRPTCKDFYHRNHGPQHIRVRYYSPFVLRRHKRIKLEGREENSNHSHDINLPMHLAIYIEGKREKHNYKAERIKKKGEGEEYNCFFFFCAGGKKQES